MYTVKANKESKYSKLVSQLNNLNSELKVATSKNEINYLEMEIMMLEEIIANTINKGRR